MKSILEQVKDHAIAIISLVVAIAALGYTAWREEVSEKNRTTRVAAFEVLKNLGDLQLVVNHAYYNDDKKHDIANDKRGATLVGWSYVATISDLSILLPEPLPQDAENLTDVWGEEWQKLSKEESSTIRVSEKIDTMRNDVRTTLRSLR